MIEDKLTKEKEANINLYSTVMMNKESKDPTPGSFDKPKKKFLSDTCCIEIRNPEPLQGATVVCMDTYPAHVPVNGPDGIMFLETKDPRAVAMIMKQFAKTWKELDLPHLLEKQERKRTTSYESSSSSQADPQLDPSQDS